MQIDDRVLEKLEKLSYINIDDNKKDEIISQLSDIVSYVENLNELDTDNLNASFSTLSGGTPLREDLPKEDSSIVKSILSNTSYAEDDFFIVPAIIE
ncbi:Aspartyl-tRNA(Asn) amidotransferase subunit C @ Glutamyl-tRNA(Gln) amidotransferase subunit C [hydrothermal vent metagenome]|uniref:Aspartyl-tRNA(Asn) amidotransferase subunit C @ Glutamyl-tRNA(Gln) amidotransferase subunit C n=1 Tax=hydrothermal vent metagenome TaxID=652676 RepID=A0A1W1EJI6_9ZZZZ